MADTVRLIHGVLLDHLRCHLVNRLVAVEFHQVLIDTCLDLRSHSVTGKPALSDCLLESFRSTQLLNHQLLSTPVVHVRNVGTLVSTTGEDAHGVSVTEDTRLFHQFTLGVEVLLQQVHNLTFTFGQISL
ncbi:hypothetical protein CEDELDFK_00005 [Klebsiella phage 066025]|nr:hypothetical protein CEDELDFK_00005 [Klebsiella phage 066025]QOV06977.1 hypothetical protein KDLGFLPC_00005 [Klebsiella phage 066036]QOV07605.1 hypothetical protein CGBLCFBE_00005 [Klebsiella phage 066121]